MQKALFILVLLFWGSFYAQEKENDTIPEAYYNPYKYMPKLKVFLDCPRCDMDYIQQRLQYRDFVRDQKYADVYVIIRTQTTGSGGEEHDLEFIGKEDFEDIYHKTKFTTSPTNSFSEKRDLMLNNIGLGLISYGDKHHSKYYYLVEEAANRQRNNDSTSVSSIKTSMKSPEVSEDKWNNWVFNIGANGSLNGQETSRSGSLGGNLSAKRVTEKNKFLFRGDYNYRESKFDYGDFNVTSNERIV